METIRWIECECGEDIYEDDKNEAGELACINCGKVHQQSDMQESEVIKITHIKKA